MRLPDTYNTRHHSREKPCLSLFGIWLRGKRHELGIPLIQACEDSGIVLSTMNDYERGKRHPSPEKIDQLSRWLGIDRSEIWQQVETSLEYLRNTGLPGILELESRQPKFRQQDLFRQAMLVLEKRDERGDVSEPNVWLRPAVGARYREKIKLIAEIYDMSESAIVGRFIEHSLDNGELEKYHAKNQ